MWAGDTGAAPARVRLAGADSRDLAVRLPRAQGDIARISVAGAAIAGAMAAEAR